jgi:hypothetical protein
MECSTGRGGGGAMASESCRCIVAIRARCIALAVAVGRGIATKRGAMQARTSLTRRIAVLDQSLGVHIKKEIMTRG